MKLKRPQKRESKDGLGANLAGMEAKPTGYVDKGITGNITGEERAGRRREREREMISD